MSTPKIQILYDPQGLEDTTEKQPSTTITNISEYVNTYKLISEKLDANASIKVIVKNLTVFTWLSKLIYTYPQETIEIKEVKPRMLLAEKWGFEIPDEVHDEDIIQLNLLGFEGERKSYSNFTDFILSKFVSPTMNTENLPLDDLSNLATSLSSNNAKRNLDKPLVQREFGKKIESWMTRAKSENEREIAAMLFQNPQGLRTALSQYAILANYPIEAGERAMGKIFLTIKNLGLIAKHLKIDSDSSQAAASSIGIFLNSEFHNCLLHSDVISIINWCSGLVFEEFMVIENLLKKHPEVINKDVLQALEQKFSGVPQRIQPAIRKLSLMIRPAIPSDPDTTWDAITILRVGNTTIPALSLLARRNKPKRPKKL